MLPNRSALDYKQRADRFLSQGLTEKTRNLKLVHRSRSPGWILDNSNLLVRIKTMRLPLLAILFAVHFALSAGCTQRSDTVVQMDDESGPVSQIKVENDTVVQNGEETQQVPPKPTTPVQESDRIASRSRSGRLSGHLGQLRQPHRFHRTRERLLKVRPGHDSFEIERRLGSTDC